MDQVMLDLFKAFDTKYTVTSLSKPFTLAGYLTLLSTGNQIVCQYLAENNFDTGNDKISNKLNFINVDI